MSNKQVGLLAALSSFVAYVLVDNPVACAIYITAAWWFLLDSKTKKD